ncbi:T9SS type A sorting domain-containing protein [Hymenobacter sp. DG25B]|uniref:T9SS type A sorting domain-containing protein n=1 Tax=Hymenobacter sp. DG25B TaxID=1385664 RepID=UPI0006621E59|nr:T9SS type A sorting domain-containing protein [Hymenobacter sp. DG25B]
MVSLTGKRIASPTLTATPATLTFSATAPAASAEQSYHLVGANLTQSVSTTTAVGYEISATSGGPYTTKLSLTASAAGDLDRYVYVRLKGNQGAGTVNGTIENFSGALGAPVTVNGTVAPNPSLVAEPKTQGLFTFGTVSGSTIQVNLVAGSGTRRLLVVREASAVNGDPQDGVAYKASARFGAGDVTQPGNYVVYSGNSASITVTNLTAGTAYYFALYEYNGSGNTVNFLTPGFTGNTSTTTVLPTGGPGELVMEESFNYGPSAKLTDNGWVVISGSTNSIVTSAASLSYAEYGALPSGSYAANVSNSGEDALKLIGRSFTTGDMYTSLLVQVNNVGVNNEYFFALSPSSLYTSYTGRIHLKNGSVPNTFNVGISFNGTVVNSAQIVYATNANNEVVNYTAGSSYLLVVKYTKKPGTLDDVIKLFVFDAGVPTTEPISSANTATVTADFTGSGGTAFTTEQNPAGIALRQYNASQSITVDGLRVGTGWGATVGRPVFTNDTYNLLAGNYYDVTLTGATTNIQAVGKSYIQSQLNLLNGRLLTSSANLVTVGSSAQTNKGNANSFVEGPLARVFQAGGATLTFGIGRDGIYRPFTLGLLNTVSATVLSAEMVNEATPNGSSFATGSELNRTSRVRYFRVTRLSGPDASAAQATLSYGNDDDVVEPATLRVAKSANNSANAYANIGPVTGGTATPAGSITSDLFSESFATPVIFALANKIGGFNPLPVELTAFTAERQGAAVQVKWSTASERNSASFLIERSADGLTFQAISKVAAQGNATSLTSYQFVDIKPLSGLGYYRLRQLDQDGSAHLSVVRTVQGRQLQAGIYPNPVQQVLHVEVPATNGVVQAIITDLVGREVYRTIVPASRELDLSQLPQGSYLLVLDGQLLHSTHKLVKSN